MIYFPWLIVTTSKYQISANNKQAMQRTYSSTSYSSSLIFHEKSEKSRFYRWFPVVALKNLDFVKTIICKIYI